MGGDDVDDENNADKTGEYYSVNGDAYANNSEYYSVNSATDADVFGADNARGQ